MHRFLALLALAAAVLSASCASSKTFVLQPVKDGEIHGLLTINRLEPTIEVDPKSTADFESRLTEQLRTQLGAQVGQPADLIVEYRFVLFDQGSSGARVGSGLASLAGSPIYGLGDGSVGVEIVYKKPAGTIVGHIVTDGPISGAFGSTSGALDSAANAVAKYTKANFTCHSCGQVGTVSPSPAPVDGLKPLASR